MHPYTVALVTCILPFLTIHLSFLIAASYGHIDWCFPYGIDCKSISSTGRNPPEMFIFKPLIIISAVFMLYYWQIATQYLKLQLRSSSSPAQERATKRIITISILGVLAPSFLILYSTFLGEHGDSYRLYRKIGITLGFTLTYLCQLLLTSCLISQKNPSQNIIWAFRINIILLTMGIFSLILDGVYGEYDRLENGFEWSFALLLCLHTFLIAREWRLKGFISVYQLKP